MARKVANSNAADESAAVELSRGITAVVLKLMKNKGLTQTQMAEQLGYTRSSFCQIVHAAEASRLWRLPTLCGLSRVLGVPVDAIISGALHPEDDLTYSGRLVSLITFGTEERTPERLQILIWEFSGKDEAQSAVRLFEIGCRKFTSDYYSGALSDRDAYEWLSQADTDRRSENNEEKRLPLWAALSEMYTD